MSMKKLITIAVSLGLMAASAFAVAPVTNNYAVGTAFSTSELYKQVVRTVAVDTTVTPANTNDVFVIMNIPSNTFVERVFMTVTTPNTNATATIGVGDAASATRFLSAKAITAAASFASASTATVDTNLVATVVESGYLYASGGSIRVKFSAPETVAKFTISAALTQTK